MADHNHSHRCSDEHEHEHGGGDGHSHDDDITPALQTSLYKHIDFDKVTTLNEASPGSGRDVVKKTWTERLDMTRILESDADEQLLMFIPFTGTIKLHSLLLRPHPLPHAPKTLKLYANRDDLDFTSIADTPATQTLELPIPTASSSPEEQVFEIPVKRALFGNVQSLTLFFEDNHGGEEEEETKVAYLGFRGTWTELKREAVVALYEAAPNPKDHKVHAGKGKVGHWSALGGEPGHGF
ncbi:hypothetical protein RUND412_007394 [Rhizina undulata]